MHLSVSAAILAFVTVTAVAFEGSAAADLTGVWNLRDQIPLDQVIVQAHRGAGNLMAENSVEAFELAWKLGTIPEADLRTTRDGVIVSFHDKNFQRILPNASAEQQAQGIEDLTWKEVARLDIGAWKGPESRGQRVARLSDLFELLKADASRRIYVDIKEVDLEQLAREAKAAGLADRLILASTHYEIITRWKSLAAESATLHWMGGSEAELAERIAKLRDAKFAGIDQLQIHVRKPDGRYMPSPVFLKNVGEELRMHKILFQVFPWDMEDPQDFWNLMDLGVASFATDEPKIAKQAIRDYYARPR